MAGGVPVLRHDDVLELLGELVDDRHDLLAALDRQRAAGDEAVLHVDDDQRGVATGLDRRGPRALTDAAEYEDSESGFEAFTTLAIHAVLPFEFG